MKLIQEKRLGRYLKWFNTLNKSIKIKKVFNKGERKMGWNVVKEDERYIVTDNDTLKRLVTSTTELNVSHSTTGHSHAGQEEVYIFRSGSGEMEINEKRFEVNAGDIIFIEDGDFHRVHNTSDKKLEFVCVFDGVRSH